MSLCPQCASRNSKVLDTRVDALRHWLRRRRDCMECDFRWATYEIPESALTITDNVPVEDATDDDEQG